MTVLTFSMAGLPRGKGRPRTSVRGGIPRVYTDAATRKYEASISKVAVGVMAGRRPLDGPLSVSVRLRLSPPISMSKRERARVLAGEQPYFGRVDVDNAAKAVLDALNGICWGDDNQIVRLFVTKIAAEMPGIDLRIEAYAPTGDAP